MKRYTRIDLNSIFIWIILPILLFFFSMNTVYAYFTATAKQQKANVTTATINVNFENEEVSTKTEQNVITEYVVPGSDIIYSGNVVNTGTIKMYCILEFNIMINDEVICNSFHTATGTKLTNNSTQFTSGATVIEKDGSSAFTLSYNLDGELYDETYMGATISMKVTAHAIQYAHVTDAIEAVNLLVSVSSIV